MKKKKRQEISFYTCVPKIMIRWCMVPEKWCKMDRQKKWNIEVGAPPKKWGGASIIESKTNKEGWDKRRKLFKLYNCKKITFCLIVCLYKNKNVRKLPPCPPLDILRSSQCAQTLAEIYSPINAKRRFFSFQTSALQSIS